MNVSESTPNPNQPDPKVLDLLLAQGLTRNQATRPACTWPLDAVEHEIKRIRADPNVRNFAAVLAKRLASDPPAAPASQRGAVDGPGGDSTGSGGPKAARPRWAAERLKTTERLRARLHRQPERYLELWRRLRQHFLGIYGDKYPNLTNHPSTLLDFGPAQDLARAWGYLEGDADDDTDPNAAR
jgi:hypothetical protein